MDFVSLILHAREFFSLEKCFRFVCCSRVDDLGNLKKRRAFKERVFRDEIFLSETTQQSLSLVPLSRAVKRFKEERERLMRVLFERF